MTITYVYSRELFKQMLVDVQFVMLENTKSSTIRTQYFIFAFLISASIGVIGFSLNAGWSRQPAILIAVWGFIICVPLFLNTTRKFQNHLLDDCLNRYQGVLSVQQTLELNEDSVSLSNVNESYRGNWDSLVDVYATNHFFVLFCHNIIIAIPYVSLEQADPGATQSVAQAIEKLSGKKIVHRRALARNSRHAR